MVSPSLVSRYISNKVWNATIKIPELKTTLPATSSLFDVDQVVAMVTDMFQQHKGGLLVVTGAGVSTDSGIPDYRGDQVWDKHNLINMDQILTFPPAIDREQTTHVFLISYVRNPNHRPILYHELASSHNYRQRYWSRSYLGWPKMSESLPNATHDTLKKFVDHGYIQNIITQNVDNLHTKAGTPDRNLLELHGTLYKVECMDCGDTSADRNLYQHRIHARNPSWNDMIGKGKINPDGDVELPKGASYDEFDIPPCLHCGSQKMKPKLSGAGDWLVTCDLFFVSPVAPSKPIEQANWYCYQRTHQSRQFNAMER
ncbi:hypothetical protein G6F42_022430 [Rhizopus arrhizus]|nr:hypothetical protein G6F42_022430 [Rhizopus arrhizus]